MRTIKRDIAGALIFSKDGYVLIGKNVKGGVYDDLWTIPGGGINEGESKEDAVKREILEEVGIDVTNAKIEPIGLIQTGATEKTLVETGERVIVDMTFNNFKVTIDLPAKDIKFKTADDFQYAEWVQIEELSKRTYPLPLEATFKYLGIF